MSKRFKIILLSAVSTLLALFIAMLFLAVPMGDKGVVLPILAFYITAIAEAGVLLLAGIVCVICRIRGLTSKGSKYYDNKNIPDYPCFWESGGEVEYGEDGFIKNSCQGPWRIEHAFCDFPDFIERLLPELLRVMNENVPGGCCGGCMFKPIEI